MSETATIYKRKTRELKPNPKNLKKHPPEQIRLFKKALLYFGQRKQTPLVIDSEGLIRKGNGTWMTMMALLDEGHTRFEEAWVIDLDDLEGDDVVAWENADNRLSELGGWDERPLLMELQELTQNGYDLEVVGFTDQDLEGLEAEIALMAEELSDQGGHPHGAGPPAPPGAEDPPDQPDPPPNGEDGGQKKLTLTFAAADHTQLIEDLAFVRDKEALKTDADAVLFLARLYANPGAVK